MGKWSTIAKWIKVAVRLAPLIPKLPQKVRVGVSKVGEAEAVIEGVVKDGKPTTPAA